MTAAAGNAVPGLPSLRDSTRIVIKVGSALLVDFSTGRLNRAWLTSLATETAALVGQGKQVIVVSSGSIALGRKYLAIEKEQLRLDQQQAAAAAGQILLAHAYQELLGQHDVKVAQILLTLDDTENRRRYLNARSTLNTLLELGVIPIINENDSVATDEIRYGDNDRLAARVAEMCSADCLVLLSDVNGLYDADPATNPDAKLIPLVREITPDIEARAGAARTSFGSGGMITKLAAAKICVPAGCATVIANGRTPEPLAAIDNGVPCTWFLPSTTPRAARKRWIAGTLEPRGTLTIDAGAEQSLIDGRSLLPVGIIDVTGTFDRGDAVIVKNPAGKDLARGLSAYSSDDTRLIMGHRTADAQKILGYRDRDEVIHRDNLVRITVFGHNSQLLRIAVVLILGTALTGFAFTVARILEDQRIARELEIGAVNRVTAVQRGFNEQLRLLESVAAYWTVLDGTNYSEFRAFVTPLIPRSPHLAAIGWAPVITADERPLFETAAQAEGLEGYRITERGADGSLIPARSRDFYVPVLHIEPLAGNEPAVGFDLWSENDRRSALMSTRDTGLPHTTRRLHLVQEQRPRNGLLSALAVYRRGSILDTVEDRHEALVGFISQVYWLDDVIEAELARLVPTGIDLYFLDSAEGADAQPIHVHSSRIRTGEPAPPWSSRLTDQSPTYIGRLDVGGRQWSVACLPAPGFVSARRGPIPWVLLAIGMLATLVGLIALTTTEKHNRERLKRQERFLQGQKLESLGLLAGGIAHDFNNLLTVILGNASLARDSIATTGPARTALDGVVKAAKKAALLTHQLVAYTGKGTQETQPVDLSKLVLEIGDLIHTAIPKKIVLKFDLANGLPTVDADITQMQQLVMNLVINGAEAADEQSGRVCVRTGTQEIHEDDARALHTSRQLQPGTYVYLAVQDDGHGMDPETRARIFDPFFSTKFTGRGLGLAAVLGIVHGHDGSIEVKSTPGAGSEFKVFLPVSGEPALHARESKPREAEPQGTGLVLVVDDEGMIRQLAAQTLTKLGYHVLTAADGHAAIEIFRTRGAEIDCVLLDLTMPRLDGIETFRALLTIRPDVTVILSSGYDETDANPLIDGKHAAGFLQKPYTVSELGAKIKDVMKAHRKTELVGQSDTIKI